MRAIKAIAKEYTYKTLKNGDIEVDNLTKHPVTIVDFMQVREGIWGIHIQEKNRSLGCIPLHHYEDCRIEEEK